MPPVNPAIADRLRRLRTVLGFRTQMAFAEYLGVKVRRYQNVESGKYRLGIDLLDIIVDRCPGVSRDWLKEGRTGDMALGLLRRLGELPSGNEGRFRA